MIRWRSRLNWQFRVFEDETVGLGRQPAEVADFAAVSNRPLLFYRAARWLSPPAAGGPGKRDTAGAEQIRQAAALAVQQARSLQVAAVTLGVATTMSLAPELTGQAFAEGFELGARTAIGSIAPVCPANRPLRSSGLRCTPPASGRNWCRQASPRARSSPARKAGARSGQRPGYAVTPARAGRRGCCPGPAVGTALRCSTRRNWKNRASAGILAVGKGSANERAIVMEHGELAEGKAGLSVLWAKG